MRLPGRAGMFVRYCRALVSHVRLLSLPEPWVPGSIAPSIVGVQVDEDALNLKIADLEDIAPAPCMRHSCTPLYAICGHSRRGPFYYHEISLHDVVEIGIVVADRLQDRAQISEQSLIFAPTSGKPPFWEIDLCVVGEQVKDVLAAIQPFQILERDGLTLLIGHGLL